MQQAHLARPGRCRGACRGTLGLRRHQGKLICNPASLKQPSPRNVLNVRNTSDDC